MTEKLLCLQCKPLICTDASEGWRIIGNMDENTDTLFPEPVALCARRRVNICLEDAKKLQESTGDEVV